MEPALVELRRRLAEITDLRRAQGVLYWDLETWMPPNGTEARAAQLATLASLIHEKETDERIGELLDELAGHAASLPQNSDDACLVRMTRRDWERARRVPTELAMELAQAVPESRAAWVAARELSEFSRFRPSLERMLELRLRRIECFAPYDDPYDVALDQFEPGMRTQEVQDLFDALEPALVGLVSEHASSQEDDFLHGPFPIDAQDALSRDVIGSFGATWDSFRLDRVVHPFEIAFGLGDVRLTTRYAEDDLSSLFTAMHECGHGLYEWGVSPTLDRTPLCMGASSALHESQSRLWENVIGRSLPFWRWYYPRVQAAFPDALGEVSLEDFHRAVNRPQRTFVRVDADETTYGLHVILRFDLEQRLLSGELAVADLPEAWNARFEELMGIPVPNDALGALQDSHWASTGFGYFPTYLVGSVLSVQIWDALREALPEADEHIERGDFTQIHGWLRENVYAHGRKYLPAEIVERVVGGPIRPEPYLAYLRDKLETLSLA